MAKKPRKILFEDLTAMSDKWATGMSGRSAGPRQLTLLDILGRSPEDAQHPNNVVAKGPDVYGSQMMVELLGDLHLQASRVKDAIVHAKKSPLLKGRDKANAQLAKMVKKLNMIQKLVASISKDVDEFVVDKQSE